MRTVLRGMLLAALALALADPLTPASADKPSGKGKAHEQQTAKAKTKRFTAAGYAARP